MGNVDETTDALKVSRGSILMANHDREYVNKENTLQIKAGDKIIVGYDGLLYYCLLDEAIRHNRQ